MQNALELRLRHAVAAAVSAALATPACAAIQEDGAAADGAPPGACADGHYVLPTGPSLRDPTIEYVEIRREYDLNGERRRVVLGSGGSPCAGAALISSCRSDLAAQQSPRGWDSGSAFYPAGPPALSYLTYTSAGKVRYAVSQAEATQLVVPVDTVNKAAFAALVHGITLKCGAIEPAGSGFAFTISSSGCGSAVTRRYAVGADGSVERVSEQVAPSSDSACVGRRPVGLASGVGEPSDDRTGDFFSGVARLEAAAVIAFEHLAATLERFGAPAPLVTAARAARGDEIRHAEQMNALAARFGGTRLEVEVAPWRKPSLLELALENEVEGCVRETYGAVVAALQAERAARPDVAVALAAVARDELRHAQLSWEIGQWAAARLTADERALVAVARHQARAELRAELTAARSEVVMRESGVPDAPTALRAFAALDAALWG